MISEELYSAILGPINIKMLNHSSYITVPFQGVWQELLRAAGTQSIFPDISLWSFPFALSTRNSKLENWALYQVKWEIQVLLSKLVHQTFAPNSFGPGLCWIWIEAGRCFQKCKLVKKCRAKRKNVQILCNKPALRFTMHPWITVSETESLLGLNQIFLLDWNVKYIALLTGEVKPQTKSFLELL